MLWLLGAVVVVALVGSAMFLNAWLACDAPTDDDEEEILW